MEKTQKQCALWAKIAAYTTLILIIVGAATRVTQSGMACPDWPMCYGVLIPFPEPESGYIVNGIHHEWWQVMLEWGHRLLASLVGLFMLIIAYFSFKLRAVKPKLWKATIVALVLLLSQVKLGGLTVILSNINWSVALHLGNAMLFYGALLVVKRLASQPQKPTLITVGNSAKKHAWALLIVVFATMLMGAMISSSHAGGVCGGLLDCMGEWWPEDVKQKMHMTHRILAVLTLFTAIVFNKITRQEPETLHKSAKGINRLIDIQVLIGVITLYSFSHYGQYYHFLSVFHLTWGTLVFSACVGTLSKIYFGVEGGFHDKK